MPPVGTGLLLVAALATGSATTALAQTAACAPPPQASTVPRHHAASLRQQMERTLQQVAEPRQQTDMGEPVVLARPAAKWHPAPAGAPPQLQSPTHGVVEGAMQGQVTPAQPPPSGQATLGTARLRCATGAAMSGL